MRLTDFLHLLVRVCYSKDNRHYVFIHSYCSYCKSCNHDTLFALILPLVLFLSTCVFVRVITNVAVLGEPNWLHHGTKKKNALNMKHVGLTSVSKCLFSTDIVF